MRHDPTISRAIALLGALAIGALALAGCRSDDPDAAPVVDPPAELAAPGDPDPDSDALEDGSADGGSPSPAVADASPAEPAAPGEPVASHGIGAYGVSAGHPAAVDVGMSVLAGGGNAVDAAIAAAYAVSVVEPFASGLGGGGSALVFAPGEPPIAYDYREVLRQSGQMPATDTGVPGFVAGMEQLHADHGVLPLPELIEHAAALAEHGVEASEMLAERIAGAAGRLRVADLSQLYPDGAALALGAPLIQAELAATLRAVADGGAEAFYRGELAERLSELVEGVDRESLAAYEVARLEPPSGPLGDYTVYSSAPSLPGATLVQLLQIAEALGVADYEPESADFIHAVSMALRVAQQFLFADIADPAFHDVPVEALTHPDLNAGLAEQISMDRVLSAGHDRRAQAAALAADAPNTTQVTVADADGMVVSMTNTVSNFWGSGQYALGFFLNDQLRYFRTTEANPNPPAPGKRPVSYACPTVLADAEGRPVLALGTPGGRRIPSVVAQVVLRWALHGQDLPEAVAANRFHRSGGVLEFEQLPGPEVAAELRARGHGPMQIPAFRYHFGSVQALEIDYDAGQLIGAADERREAAWRVEQAP